jgi:hypothetical protein
MGSNGGESSFNNAGTFMVYGSGVSIGAMFNNTGTVEVKTGGWVDLPGAVQKSGSQLTGGTWIVRNQAQLSFFHDNPITDNYANVTLDGPNSFCDNLDSLVNNAGKLSLVGGRVFSTYNAFTNRGILVIGSGSKFNANSPVFTQVDTGTITGGGTLGGNLQNAGILAPGDGLGTFTVAVNYTQTATGRLNIEIGGHTRGSEYDLLSIGGAASLGGQLGVTLTNGFIPAGGDAYDILDWNSLSGTFSNIMLPTLPGGMQWNTSQLYLSGKLSVVGPAVIGDYNDNGTVDMADYIVWRKGLGTRYTVSDYNLWRSRLGGSSGSGSAINGLPQTAVPEPAVTKTLLAAALMLVARMPRYRRG